MGRLNMKTFLLYTLFFYSLSASALGQTDDYRYNPFRFELSEHHLKADSIPINSISQLPNEYKAVDFNNYQFFIPNSAILKKADKSTLVVLDENKKGLFIITLKPSNIFTCFNDDNRKDFCSVFDSRRELFVKTFTLTPNDLSQKKYASKSIGHSWLIYYKASKFENVTSIKMYNRDGFIFFRQNSIHPHPMADKAFFFISSPKNDELLDIVFLVNDEKLIMNVIKSFQLIK